MRNSNKYEIADVKRATEGRWDTVFQALCPQLEAALACPGHHVDCPIHGGKEDFRLDRGFKKRGTAICTCGNWDGFSLLKELNGWTLPEILEQIMGALGERAVEPLAPTKVAQPARPDAEKRDIRPTLRKRWQEALPLNRGEGRFIMASYLQFRGLPVKPMLALLEGEARVHPNLPYLEQGKVVGRYPTLLTLVRDAEGKPVTVHRTYLVRGADGIVQKAPVAKAKKLFPVVNGGEVSGGAIRLGAPSGGVLGIAEGIETALAVRAATGMVVWPVLSASLMGTFEPPEGLQEVVIWADRDLPDRKGRKAGQDAAKALQARLWEKGVKASVRIPNAPSTGEDKSVDWADVYVSGQFSGMTKETQAA
jgi:phage/plasmid primase-like uncharacterized protein|tara:strand:+ start:4924 stop:6018 length:1095 start_codon:yes stop_codon:yes gene_type:complete